VKIIAIRGEPLERAAQFKPDPVIQNFTTGYWAIWMICAIEDFISASDRQPIDTLLIQTDDTDKFKIFILLSCWQSGGYHETHEAEFIGTGRVYL